MFRLLIFILPTLTVLWWFFADRALRKGLPKRHLPRVALAAFVLLELAYIVFRFMSRSRGWSVELPLFVTVSGYVWHLVIVPLVVIPSLVYFLCEFAVSVVEWLRNRKPAAPETMTETEEEAAPEGITRRQMIGLSVAAAAPALTVVGAGVAIPQLDDLRVRRFDVAVPDLPVELEGFVIAHLSDMHSGRFTGVEVFERMVRETEALKPDLIVVTGDLIDYAMRDLPVAVAPLQKLQASIACSCARETTTCSRAAKAFAKGCATRACGCC